MSCTTPHKILHLQDTMLHHGHGTMQLSSPAPVAHATHPNRPRRHNLHRRDHQYPTRPSVQCDVAVGIDLGTTSSAIALIRPEDGQPYILHDRQGKAIIPSVVAYTHDGQVVVGTAAQSLMASSSSSSSSSSSQQQQQDLKTHTIITQGAAAYFYSVKRLMGRQIHEVTDLSTKLPYPVVNMQPEGWAALVRPTQATAVAGKLNNQPQPTVTSDLMLPQEVSAHVLRHLLERAEAHLSEQPTQPTQLTQQTQQNSTPPTTSGPTLYPPLQIIREAVITVPAHFSAAARKATIDAGRMAGLTRVEVLQEPIAAALAYGFGVGGPSSSSYDTLLVFDLGGGTFDVSLLEGWDGILEVLVTDGDNELGGDDLTRTLADLILRKAGSRSLSELPPALRLTITRLAEDLKLRLSQAEGTQPTATSTDSTTKTGLAVQLPPDLPMCASNSSSASKQESGTSSSSAAAAVVVHHVHVAGDEVEHAWSPLLNRLWPPLHRLASSSCVQFNGRMPDAIATTTNNNNNNTSSSSNPHITNNGIGQSTGTNSGTGGGGGKVLASHPLFVSEANTTGILKYSAPPRRLTGVVLVGAATRTPAVKKFIMQLCGADPASGADPEEVVALGAALQAGVLSGAVGRGAELTDGGYIASEHGRSTGWSSDVEVEWRP